MLSKLLKAMKPLFRYWRKKEYIVDAESFHRFTATRSSYVAQVSLYGYLKTRAGTRYFSLIKDPFFEASMKKARNRIYFTCLEDLIFYAVGRLSMENESRSPLLSSIASATFKKALKETPQEIFEDVSFKELLSCFEKRLSSIVWGPNTQVAEAFSRSIQALLQWAPVVKEMKKDDAEIVSNSIYFKWLRVCQEYKNLLDAEKVLTSW